MTRPKTTGPYHSRRLGLSLETKATLSRSRASLPTIACSANTQHTHPYRREICWPARRSDGNSEVGHLNIGAGRIVHMDSTRIELMIQNGEFFSNHVLLAAMKNARSGAGASTCSTSFRWGVHST